MKPDREKRESAHASDYERDDGVAVNGPGHDLVETLYCLPLPFP